MTPKSWVRAPDPKNPSYPSAFEICKKMDLFVKEVALRQIKYLNNIIEQDHRFVKKRAKSSSWFQSFKTAKVTIAGYETMHLIRKGQLKIAGNNDTQSQIKFIEELFGIAA